jgi:mRNA-degrading endonuclease toxin of MazEF toxin-antitoxin module
VSPLQQGRIIWATICDPNGKNPKERPAVIVTATAELRADGPIVVVAITSRLKDPLSPDHVELPWQRGGHPRTGLKKRCAALCAWLIVIRPSDITEYAGVVPESKMRAILERIPRIPSQPPEV